MSLFNHPRTPIPRARSLGVDMAYDSVYINNIKDLPPRPSSDTSRRTVLGLTLAALTAACGFTPVYAPGGAADGLRGSLFVAAPEDRKAFVLVRQLEQRLGQPDNAPYLLSYTITTTRQGVGITPSQETTRYNVLGRIDYTVTDRATKAAVAQGKVENFTGYSATGSIVGTISATEDAEERLMIILADQIISRLIATSPDWRR